MRGHAFVLARPTESSAGRLSPSRRLSVSPPDAAEIDSYAHGEPEDKAGAYAIQGGAASFVVRVVGSHTNVIGLPMDELRTSLERHGLLAPSDARDDRER